MRTNKRERNEIRSYFEAQDFGEITHLEKVASERAGGISHDIWDVHCTDGRWWAVTEPLNAYSQEDFKSRDVVLTFHVGLMIRIAEQRRPPVNEEAAALLPGGWRRWQQAVDALPGAHEAEDFQAIGVRLRECLVSFAAEVATDELVPDGETPPKAADVVGWTNLLVDALLPDRGQRQWRSYLRKTTRETWDYVNWLTHAKNARFEDAEFGIAAVEHLLTCATATFLRAARTSHRRCSECGSYAMGGERCRECGWTDPDYEEPPFVSLSQEELEERLAEPCTPSSDISTLITVDDAVRGAE
ncbi:MAG: hypothetical protein JST08_01165 [Actinobacteria bacterium]|nr:hypothetical protein [Actinomycetota bacterium]